MIYKTLTKFLIGVIIILGFIWLRFIRQRSAISLDYFTEPKNNYIIILYMVFLISFLILFYTSLRNIFNIQKDTPFINRITTSTTFVNIKKILLEYIINAPAFVYDKTTERFSLKSLIELPASYFTAYFNYPKFFVWLFFFLPRISVAMCFMIELIFFHELKIFILIINLLIPFIIAKVICFIFLQYSLRILQFLTLYLNVSHDDEYDLIYHLKDPNEIPTDSSFPYSRVIQQYGLMCNLYTIYSQIRDYMLKIKAVENKFNPLVTVITSFCYFLTWLYILDNIIYKLS